MAFVVVFFRGEEMDRRELSAPMVIGRAPECDLSVRDILMSRRHCRLVPADKGGWAIEDLGSKNGTRINGEAVTFSLLRDGASMRMGNTQVKFYTGAMQAAPASAKRPTNGDARRRPSDPFESLSGTVTDFQFVPGGPARDTSRLPTPRPQPADPSSYAKEDVYTMLTEIASSSWDSIYATASGPAAVAVAGQKPRTPPKAGAKVAGAGPAVAVDMPPRRRLVVTDPCLQADHPTKVMTAVAGDSVSSDAPERRRWLAPVGSMWRGMKYVFTARFLRRAS